MKYDYEPGTILIDRTYGIEWIVVQKIPGGVRIKVNREGGAFADATDRTCRIRFRAVRS